jgi:hypothetical protein
MNNNTKKYEMGGAVQSFSSPMLAQGMQGGLSGFGTSGLGMFEKGGLLGKDDLDFLDSINDQHKMADGGQMSDIERILAKYRDIQSNQSKKDPTQEFLNKSWEGKNLDDYIMYSDKYGKGGRTASIGDSGIITDKNSMFLGKMATITGDLGNMYEVRVGERTTIVKKNGINIISDEYGDGGEVNKYEAIFDQLKKGDVVLLKLNSKVNGGNDLRLIVKSKKLVGKGKPFEAEQITFAIANNLNGKNFYAYKRKNGYVAVGYLGSGDLGLKDISIEKKYADGGEVNKYEAIFDQLKKGDVISISYGDAISKNNETRLQVKSKNLVGKGKSWESEKITFSNLKNPNGVKYFAYKRKNGYISFASGDMSISIKEISIENKFEDGGVTFIEYKDNEIMYEPIFNKYYANEVEFDTLEEAQRFLDSGEMSDSVRGAYERGLFAKGGKVAAKFKVGDKVVGQFRYEYGEGLQPVSLYDYADKVNGVISEVKKREDVTLYVIKFDNGEELQYPDFAIDNFIAKRSFRMGGQTKKGTWIAIFEKGSERKVLEVEAETLEEAKIQAEKQKVRYGLNKDLFLNDIFRKYAQGGEVGGNFRGVDLFEDYEMQEPKLRKIIEKINDAYDEDEVNTKFLGQRLKEAESIGYTFEIDMDGSAYGLRPIGVEITELEGFEEYAKGGEVKGVSIGDNVYAYFAHNYMGYQIVESPMMGQPYDGEVIDIITENNKKKYVVKFENGVIDKMSQVIFDDYVVKYAKGGKIGFEGLANKVAKRYTGKKVSKEYQAEYGKTYDQEEAKEVGNKVAGKVYQQQVAKKKIVRKLQRKTK